MVRLCSSMNADDYDPIAAALKEDLGNGDITTDFFVAEALHASGRIVHANQLSLPAPGRPRRFFGRLIRRLISRSFTQMVMP